MKAVLTTWFLLFGLLLQSVAWVLPAQRAGQVERLAHEVAHVIDNGHHAHHRLVEALGHDLDTALLLDDVLAEASQGPHHSHAGESGQFQGLPVAAALPVPSLARSAPMAGILVQPPSADPDSLLRPPKSLV